SPKRPVMSSTDAPVEARASCCSAGDEKTFRNTATAPMVAAPYAAATHSTLLGISTPTRSPGSTPMATKPLATAPTRSPISAKVQRPSGVTRAVWSPKRATKSSTRAPIVIGRPATRASSSSGGPTTTDSAVMASEGARGRRPVGLPLLGEGPRAFRVVGMAPEALDVLHARGEGGGAARLHRRPDRPLRGHEGRRRVPGDGLGQRLGRLGQLLGRVDDLVHHAQLVGPLGAEALVAAHQRHAQDGA